MSVKSVLDSIDLIAARCRIWAASLLTLFGGALLVDAFGGFNDLIPKESRWHSVLALATVLVARFTHSKQSAEAVIDAKADERVTPVNPIGALPAVIVLLLASMTFAACGGPADDAAALAPGDGVRLPADGLTKTESAQAWNSGYLMTYGSYSCGGESWYIEEQLTQTEGRRCCALSNAYRTDLGAGTGTGPATPNTSYNRVSFLCGPFSIPTSPVCGSQGRLCSTSTQWCQMLSRRAYTSTWQFSGWLSADLAYLPSLSARGIWELVTSYYYAPSNPGNKDGICPDPRWAPVQYFDFGA